MGLAIADVAAAALALVACVTLGDDRLTPYAFLALALMIGGGMWQRLYDRDDMLVNKTTLAQAPQLSLRHAYALLVVLLEAVFIDGALQAREIVVPWGTLLLAAILTRKVARWTARKTTAAGRCLFVGSDESYERLRSKLPDGNARAQLVGRMSLSPSEDRPPILAATALRGLIDDLGVHRVIIEPNAALPQITMDARTRRADRGRRRDAVALPAGHLDPHQARQRGSRVPLAEMVKLDYLYVAGWSLWTDIRILLRTIP